MNGISNRAGIFIGQIQERLNGGGIAAKELPKLINSACVGEEAINLYPSNNKGGCYELAYFIALKRSPYAKGNGHLDCRKAMEKLIQHTLGSCRNITKQAIFITASWDAGAYNEWKHILAEIDENIELEVYLLSGRSATRMDVRFFK